MRKLEFVTVAWFVLACLVLSHRTSRTGAAAVISPNGNTPTMIGSDTNHDDAIDGSDSHDTPGGEGGEDRVLSVGIRLRRSGGDTFLVFGHSQNPVILNGGSGNDVGNRGIAQDLLISYKPAS